MEEQLISFETAKLAKEKGFEEFCSKAFLRGRLVSNSIMNETFGEPLNDIVNAPTQSLLQKWLRDVHQIDISIKVGLLDSISKVYIYSIPFNEGLINWNKYNTYEEALEAGLYEGLKLIKNG
jgi:hypothetical protein